MTKGSGWTRDRPSSDIATAVIYEDDEIRIWDLRLAPGETSWWHQHEQEYITVCLTPGQLVGEYDVGPKRSFNYAGGEVEVVRDPGGRSWIHRIKNVSTKPWRNVVLEIKNGQIPTTAPGEIVPLLGDDDRWPGGLE